MDITFVTAVASVAISEPVQGGYFLLQGSIPAQAEIIDTLLFAQYP
jgi:hypothetical protein